MPLPASLQKALSKKSPSPSNGGSSGSSISMSGKTGSGVKSGKSMFPATTAMSPKQGGLLNGKFPAAKGKK